MSRVPIAEHAVLSDCGTAALVTVGGSVDWLCLPRFDSPALFARLLDRRGGHFVISLRGGEVLSRRYRPGGLVLDTVWTSPDGDLLVTDALAFGRGDRGHQLGRASPGVLLRAARCTAGTAVVLVEYAPRPEFGLVLPTLTAKNGAVVARGGPTVLVLATTVTMDLDGATATAAVAMGEGDKAAFALEQAAAFGPEPTPWSARKVRRGLAVTEAGWKSWSELHQRYEGPHRALVHHSGVVLQGLTYAPSGAVVAAPTTSLPEGEGSGRTWDYRYCWVRDASMTLQGLWVAACPDEAGRFFAFLAAAAATQLDRNADLQIMFGVGAERDLSERKLAHLDGWRESGPVRAGNDAWQQRQLDVYGALLDAAFRLRDQLGDLPEATRRFLVAAVDAATEHWAEDDQGIWEMRGPPRPYLHSKLMCWVAVDRGLALVDVLQPGQERTADWTVARRDIHDAILQRGWSDRAGAYTQAFGSDDLDASALLLGIVGLVPPDDARLAATIDAVERGLSDQRGLLYRYRNPDGLDGSEGTFLLCTFWLAHALAVSGQIDRARTVLDRAAGYATDLGLFAEQVDSETGQLLGNFPQAFSHLGLVTAAHSLAEAERAATRSSRSDLT
jgi:alpha,alpha-trehalase